MKSNRTGILALGASLLLLGTACSGGAFTTIEGEPDIPGSDASTEAGPLTDGGGDAGKDAEAGLDASDADAADGSDGDSSLDDADAADGHDGHDGDAGDEEGGVEAGAPDASEGGDEEACAPITWYRDDDEDGFGGPVSFEGCEPPEEDVWVTQGGDCHDDNADVHPGQTEFFDVSYEVAGGSGAKSFDYDCSGVEQTAEDYTKSDGNCSLLGGLCSGNGYLAPSPQRSGPGVDRYCGSTTYFTCSLGLGCSSSTTTKAAIRCR